jgi:prepilin-type N-terminal cleavage/methylation domain-containing protein
MLKKSNQKGFTIIEVLIVLAIAAAILLVVFLAVPALQRNSRNTKRSNDVASVASALQETISNSNGALAAGTGNGSFGNTAVAGIPQSITQATVGVMDTLDYSVVAASSTAATLPASIGNANTIILRNNLKCNNSGAAPYSGVAPIATPATSIGTAATNIATTTGATFRTYVLIYAVESTNGTNALRCLDA